MKNEQKSVKQLRQEKRERQERELAKEQKKEDRKEWRFLNFTPRALVLISFALVLVISMSVVGGILLAKAQNPYRHESLPICVITMSDGKELVFELYYDDAPIAVTVFHYFAHHKYYNGTIIDSIRPSSTHDSLKMGGYTESRNNGGVRPRMFETNSLYNHGAYQVYAREDSSNLGDPNEVGALSTIKFALGSSAEFQIGASNGNKGEGADSGRVFGRAYDDKTIANIRSYNTLQTAQPDNIYVMGRVGEIPYIKNIKFYNNKKLLENVDNNATFRSNYLTSTTREYSVNQN